MYLTCACGGAYGVRLLSKWKDAYRQSCVHFKNKIYDNIGFNMYYVCCEYDFSLPWVQNLLLNYCQNTPQGHKHVYQVTKHWLNEVCMCSDYH